MTEEKAFYDPDYGIHGAYKNPKQKTISGQSLPGLANNIDAIQLSIDGTLDYLTPKRLDDGITGKRSAVVVGIREVDLVNVQDPIIQAAKNASGLSESELGKKTKILLIYAAPTGGRCASLLAPRHANDLDRLRDFPRFYTFSDTDDTPNWLNQPCMVEITDKELSMFGIFHKTSMNTPYSPTAGSPYASSASGAAAAYNSPDGRATVPSDLKFDDTGERSKWEKPPADKFYPRGNKKKAKIGKDYTSLRTDVSKHYESLYKEVHARGGIITSAGGKRHLADPAKNRNAALFSHHKLGRAFDMSPYSCFQTSNDPYFAQSAWGNNDKIRVRQQAWNIWCVADETSPGATISVPEVEIIAWFCKNLGGGKTKMHSKKIKKRMFNFTELAAKHGFTGIYSRQHTMRGAEFGGMEWWHFQSNVGLVEMKTTFLEDANKLYSSKQILNEKYGAGAKNAEIFSRTYYRGSSWKTLKNKRVT
jgi:hypothetical protein